MAACLPDSSVRFSLRRKRMCSNECVGSFARDSRGNKGLSEFLYCVHFLPIVPDRNGGGIPLEYQMKRRTYPVLFIMLADM